jgi:hypothetical protein
MDAESAQPRRGAGGCDRDGLANAGNARMNGPRHDDTDAMQDEGAVDRQAEPAGGRRRHIGLRQSRDARAQRRDALARVDGDAEHILHRDARVAKQRADFRLYLLSPRRLDLVDFCDRDGRLRNAEQIENFHMLEGLRHHAVIGSHHQQRMVHIADAGQHVPDEALMARYVDEADDPAFWQRQISEAKVDREAARLLFRQAVGIDAGERAHQRGLAMVDMSGRRDDHGRS